ncbi:MAG TPA: VWA domain-containing protein [Candidatus Acidoferrales bacterium]|nr:VWA domain-containing protein [Candidatus Acidoferrales bacterium]
MNVRYVAGLLALALLFPAVRARAQRQSAPAKPQAAQPQQKKPAVPPQNPRINVTTGLVHMVATVMDRHDHFVTDLNQSDFKVLEDGQPQKIQFFGRETDLPLRIALLLDTSNSIRPRLQFEQDAAIDFLSTVLRRGKDDAFLMTFDNEPEVIQDFTDDASALADAIRRQRAGGGTALDDAICMASQKLASAPIPAGPNSDIRRVIVLISDGNDTLSDHVPSDAMEAVLRAEASIYAISTNTQWLSLDDESQPSKYHIVGGDKVLQQFSNETGGRVFFPYRVDDLAQSFTDIGSELRSQYFIAYAPASHSAAGQFHRIDVKTDRKGLSVRTRKGYYGAVASAASPGQ